jgi:ATPase family associated with various cellular activities (AAA)
MDQITIPERYCKLIASPLKRAGAWGGYGASKDLHVYTDNLIKEATIDELAAVKKAASKDMDEKTPGAGSMYRSFKELERRKTTLSQLEASKDGAFDASKVQIYSLKDLMPALKEAIEKTSKNRWIFVKMKDYFFTPLLVTDIKYTAPSRYNTEQVSIETVALFGKDDPKFCSNDFRIYERIFGKDSISFSIDDDEAEDDSDGETRIIKKKVKKAKGVPLSDLIARADFYLSNPELEAEYAKNYEAYSSIANKCGVQYLPVDPTVMGMAIAKDSEYRWWSSAELVGLTVDGTPSKLVIDDLNHEKYKEHFEQATDFTVKGAEDSFEGSSWPCKNPILPTLPVVRVFNLQSNEHVFVAADSVKPYVYDKTMWTKLVLPEDDMDFIQILLSSTSVNISDIIKGKARGIIVVGSGGPGLGKTLTAEITSEQFEKPFYSVQCSQLGIDPESLEKNLMTVLSRASRWEAILLLDEADVYVRRRGDDIQQNAIVGVFLRVLEYYRGIMFMTTNLGNDIDDAILSRATAHLHYELPTFDLLPTLWKVLSKQLTVNFPEGDIEKLVKHFGQLPGRSIRNLVKLTKYHAVAKNKKPIFETVVKISRYLNVDASAKQKSVPPCDDSIS